MGHVRLGTLPRTKKWVQVVELVGAEAGVRQVAVATPDASTRWLASAHKDVGVVGTIRLLMLLPLAARADDFAGGLRAWGLDLPDDPGLMDVLGAASDFLDAATPGNRGRTDLGELAQAALGEAVAGVVGRQLSGLFGTDPDDVRRAFARHATAKQFGVLAHDFFARFTAKFLDYHLSRALPLHVGDGRRFDTLAAKGRFDDELAHHCRERAKIVERFAGEWLSKENYEAGGDITPGRAADFVYGAMKKLADELRVEAPA